MQLAFKPKRNRTLSASAQTRKPDQYTALTEKILLVRTAHHLIINGIYILGHNYLLFYNLAAKLAKNIDLITHRDKKDQKGGQFEMRTNCRTKE
jgi:hypothetical protein